MNTMKTLKESILDDIEVNIMKGNDYNNMYKKAEKDYKKLLDKTTGKVFGQYYQVVIKSKELAYIIAGEHPAYKHCPSPSPCGPHCPPGWVLVLI